MANNTSFNDLESEYKYKKSKQEKINSIFPQLFQILLTLAISLTSIFYAFSVSSEDKMYGFDKATIKSKMQKTIKNGGGDLSNIKHIYDKRKISKVSSKGDDFYAQDYSLSDILYDLKIDHFNSSKDTMDTAYIDAIESLIAENNKKNPFDNLEENQKYNFQNIQEKLDSNYNKISDEMNRIADELKNKNLLVAKYLNKSESSYNISIIALFLSIAIGFTQLYQNYHTSKKIKELKDKS